jgi:hypothetical protein
MNLLDGMGGRLIRTAGLALLAGLLALAALGVGLAALYLWMLSSLTPPVALGIIAAILLVLALLACWAALRRPVPAPARPAMAPELAAVLPEAADVIRRAVVADPGAAVLGALAAGFIAESKPGFDMSLVTRILGQLQR